MRISGKITYWNTEKGYGFITPASGAKQVFVHVRAFTSRDQEPGLNQLVTFALSTDKQGRPRAARVVLAGEKNPDRFKRNDRLLMVTLPIAFLVVLGLAVPGGSIPGVIFLAYLGVSLVTLGFYQLDKSAAQTGHSRVPERNLHLLALAGGWPGAMIAQQVFRHKSSKREFRWVFWATVVINCGFLAWLFTPQGSQLLADILG